MGKTADQSRSSAKVPSDEDILIGKNLRRIRRDFQMTQEELGKLVGIAFQQIQKYECGTNRISSGRLAQIAHSLSVDIREFFRDISLKGTLELDPPASSDDDTAKIRFRIKGVLDRIDDTAALEAIHFFAQQAASAKRVSKENPA